MSVTTHLSRRSLGTVVLCIGLVAMAIGTQLAKPSKEQNEFAPSFKVVGELDEPVRMREGTVTFTKVRVTKKLKTSGIGGETVSTSGIWLLVDYRFRQNREASSMDVSLYTEDNTRYTASLRPSGGSVQSNLSGDPGFTESGVVPFEVPPGAIADSRLVVGNNSAFGLPLWDGQLVVPLGIDEARAKKLVSDAPARVTVGE